MNSKIGVYTIFLFAFLNLLAAGCKKDQQDYASQITGTYRGTTTITGTGTVACTSTLGKNSNTSVNLTITIGSTNIPLNGISVSKSGSAYGLSYTDSSGSFNGTVDGNKLTWTMTASGTTETFSGTR